MHFLLSLLSGSLEVHLRIQDNALGEPLFLLFGDTCTLKSVHVFSSDKVSKSKLEFFPFLNRFRIKINQSLFSFFLLYVFCFIQTGMLMH